MRPKIHDQAGAYDQRITIQQLKVDATPDAFGAVDGSDNGNWETYIQRWAAVEPVTGREQLRGGQTTPIGLYRLRLRSDSETRAVSPAMRISWSGRILNIESVLDRHAQKREVEITAKESV